MLSDYYRLYEYLLFVNVNNSRAVIVSRLSAAVSLLIRDECASVPERSARSVISRHLILRVISEVAKFTTYRNGTKIVKRM